MVLPYDPIRVDEAGRRFDAVVKHVQERVQGKEAPEDGDL